MVAAEVVVVVDVEWAEDPADVVEGEEIASDAIVPLIGHENARKRTRKDSSEMRRINFNETYLLHHSTNIC